MKLRNFNAGDWVLVNWGIRRISVEILGMDPSDGLTMAIDRSGDDLMPDLLTPYILHRYGDVISGLTPGHINCRYCWLNTDPAEKISTFIYSEMAECK